jgi:hypothetical protein
MPQDMEATMIDRSSTQDALATHARILGDARDDRLPLDRIFWAYDELFPVSRLLVIMSADEWRAWFDDELSMCVETRGSDDEWRRLLTEDIEEEIILLDHDGLDIWDGWHRAACMVIKGQEFAKVVLGVEKTLEPTFGMAL